MKLNGRLRAAVFFRLSPCQMGGRGVIPPFHHAASIYIPQPCPAALSGRTASNAKAAKTPRTQNSYDKRTSSNTETTETQRARRKAFRQDSLCVLGGESGLVPSTSSNAKAAKAPRARRKPRFQTASRKEVTETQRSQREKHPGRVLSVFSVPLCPRCQKRFASWRLCALGIKGGGRRLQTDILPGRLSPLMPRRIVRLSAFSCDAWTYSLQYMWKYR